MRNIDNKAQKAQFISVNLCIWEFHISILSSKSLRLILYLVTDYLQLKEMR